MPPILSKWHSTVNPSGETVIINANATDNVGVTKVCCNLQTNSLRKTKNVDKICIFDIFSGGKRRNLEYQYRIKKQSA